MSLIDVETNRRSSRDAPVRQPLGPGGTWVLDLFDDFDGAANAAPDLGIWEYWLQDQVRRAATNRAENTFLDGSSNLCVRVTTANIGHGSELSAGGLVTKTKFGLADEFYECTMSAHGWCTFWRQSTESGDGMSGLNPPPDPADGAEYDIAENYDDSVLQHAVHWGGYEGNHQTTSQGISVADKTAFNTYGMHISPSGGFVKFYVNGVLDYTFTTIISTRSDNEIRLTTETEGDITSALAKFGYVAHWVAA